MTPEDVTTAVNRIVAAVRPLKIIAFGSRARGGARADSDLDLLVVLPEDDMTPQRRFDESVHLHDILADMLFSKDILVTNPTHLAEWETERYSVYSRATREGLALWADGALDQDVAKRLCN
jgi:predicted nucleotidyltransferase